MTKPILLLITAIISQTLLITLTFGAQEARFFGFGQLTIITVLFLKCWRYSKIDVSAVYMVHYKSPDFPQMSVQMENVTTFFTDPLNKEFETALIYNINYKRKEKGLEPMDIQILKFEKIKTNLHFYE